MKYRLVKPLVMLQTGAVFEESHVSKREWFEPTFGVMVELDKDHAFEITLPESILKECPDWFEVVE